MKRSTFTILTGAALLAPRAVRAQASAPMRFGTIATESFALLFYAQEAGFFKKHGVEAQMTYFRGGGAALTALVGGSVDLACVNWGAISNAHMRGIPVQAIAAGGLYTSASPTTILAVGKDSTIRTGADLNGKTVGLSTLEDLQQAAVMKWVDQNGGTSSTMKFVELAIPQIPPALNAGRLDAGIVLEPILTAQASQIRVLAKCYDVDRAEAHDLRRGRPRRLPHQERGLDPVGGRRTARDGELGQRESRGGRQDTRTGFEDTADDDFGDAPVALQRPARSGDHPAGHRRFGGLPLHLAHVSGARDVLAGSSRLTSLAVSRFTLQGAGFR